MQVGKESGESLSSALRDICQTSGGQIGKHIAVVVRQLKPHRATMIAGKDIMNRPHDEPHQPVSSTKPFQSASTVSRTEKRVGRELAEARRQKAKEQYLLSGLIVCGELKISATSIP